MYENTISNHVFIDKFDTKKRNFCRNFKAKTK